jgi:hypothetical protein
MLSPRGDSPLPRAIVGQFALLGFLPRFARNGVTPVVACTLSLYANSAIKIQSVQSSCSRV